MRIGKTRIFQSMKYILPAFVLLSVGALAIIKNSSAATCSGYYICYASAGNGHITDPWNNPISGDNGSDYSAGNGAKAVPDSGYKFVAWKNESGETVSTDPSFTPCGSKQGGCSSSSVPVQQGYTYTAYFEVDSDAPVLTCTNYYICYAASEGGRVVDINNNSNPISGEEHGNDNWAGNGARAMADTGYVFVAWKDDGKNTLTTQTDFVPCGPSQSCSGGKISVQQGYTYTAYFERETPAPTAATETFNLGASVDTGALGSKSISLTLTSVEDDAPMPSNTQGTISQDTTSVGFGQITYGEAGTWRYKINLQTPSGAKVDAGNLEVRVRATLDETNNAIVTEKTYYKNDSELTSESDFFVHVSIDEPTPATDSFALGILVDEGALEGDETISLSLNGTPAPSETSKSVNEDTTSVSFGEMTFTEPGTYNYGINISNSHATAQPDATSLEVKIDATLDEATNTIVTQKTYYKNGNAVSESNFKLNIFIVAPEPVECGMAFINVIDPEADLSDFSASVAPVGYAPNPTTPQGEIIDGVTLSFGDVTFDKVGHYEYVAELKNGEKTRQLKLTADVVLNRLDNYLVLGDTRVLDEDDNALGEDEFRALIAELLATDVTPDDPDDSGDDSEDEPVTPSEDGADTPNTIDSVKSAAFGMIGATVFILGIAIVKRR